MAESLGEQVLVLLLISFEGHRGKIDVAWLDLLHDLSLPFARCISVPFVVQKAFPPSTGRLQYL